MGESGFAFLTYFAPRDPLPTLCKCNHLGIEFHIQTLHYDFLDAIFVPDNGDIL
jgi:hypothetical protein